MVLTEMDDVGGVLLTTALVMTAIFAAAVYIERLLVADPEQRGPLPAAIPAASAHRVLGSSRRSARGTRWTSAALVVSCYGLLLVVMFGATIDLDGTTLGWFTALDSTRVGHGLARVLVMGGQMWLGGSLLAASAFWAGWRRRTSRPLWVCGAALGAMSVAVWLMKVASHRSAPHSGQNSVLEHGMSFPSGHTAAATFCLPLIAVLVASAVDATPGMRRRLLRSAVAAAVLVGLCTMTLGYHWVTDVVGGWLVGAAFAVPALRLLQGARPGHGTEPAS